MTFQQKHYITHGGPQNGNTIMPPKSSIIGTTCVCKKSLIIIINAIIIVIIIMTAIRVCRAIWGPEVFFQQQHQSGVHGKRLYIWVKLNIKKFLTPVTS